MSNEKTHWDQDAEWLRDMLYKAAIKPSESMEHKFCMGVRDHMRGHVSLHNARLLALRLVMK
jgi:hypothetical protein